MARDIDESARLLVIERARRRCEYCLVHEEDAGFACSAIVTKVRISRRFDRSGRPIRLFDPRRDSWDEHFKLDGPIIEPLTPVGEVTARMLRLNAAERVIERRLFQTLGSYRKV